jgi:hypothetical protein
MPRLGLLLVIGAVANVITALAALFVAVQVWRVDISKCVGQPRLNQRVGARPHGAGASP